MSGEPKTRPTTVPASIWVAQLVYVAGSLGLLIVLLQSLDTGSVSTVSSRLFAALYVVVMVIFNVIWRLLVARKHIASAIIMVVVAVIINVGIAQIFIVQSAHSSFDNYYKFRGCSQLVSKSTDSAICKLPSGATIKLVKSQDKWYLDGDLPNGWF